MKKEFFLAVIIIACIACKSNKEHTANEKKYRLDTVVPATLTANTLLKYYYTISSEMSWQLQVDDKKAGNITRSTVGLLYQVAKDSVTDNKLITITYDSLHVYTKKDDSEKDADAANSGAFMSPVDHILGLMKGTVMRIIVNKEGKIVDIQGAKELSAKIMQRLQTQDERSQKMVETTIGKFTGEAFVKQNIAQSTSFYPDSAVYVGDSWIKKGMVNSDLKLEAFTHYTLNSVNNNIAEISAASQFDNLGNNVQLEGLGNSNSTMNIKGKDESQYSIDIATGMVLHTISETSLKGTVQTMVKSNIPVTIKSRKEIVVKKLL